MKSKAFFLTLLAFLIIGCKAQKTTGNKMLEQDFKPSFFVSYWNYGEENPGYVVIKDDKTLNRLLQKHFSSGLQPVGQHKKTETIGKKYKIPKDQVVVLYYLGTMRSGKFETKGIDSLKLENQLLKVYLQNPNPKPGDFRIQVISHPWIAFGVPKSYKFNNIELR